MSVRKLSIFKKNILSGIRSNLDTGYVALEFTLAMGLLVLPTALVLLQVPTYLEQNGRLKAISATVAGECADRASNSNNGQIIAIDTARKEIEASTSLSNVKLLDAQCHYETGRLTPGTKVTSTVSIQVPTAIVPGVPQELSWKMEEQHTAIIPRYRSIDE